MWHAKYLGYFCSFNIIIQNDILSVGKPEIKSTTPVALGSHVLHDCRYNVVYCRILFLKHIPHLKYAAKCSECRKITRQMHAVRTDYYEKLHASNRYKIKHLKYTLQWRHNGRDNVSNHQPHDWLLNRLFRRRSQKTSKLCVTGLCAWNSPVTGEFPAQMASKAKNISIWWRHHD